MPKTKQQFRELRPDELDALRKFAAQFTVRYGSGKQWRNELSLQWIKGGEGGGYMRFDYGPTLHRLRNELGPEWLFQFTLPT